MSQAEGERARFAAGCFWGIEVAFRRVPGVLDARVGYTGGHVEHPSYEQVCRGDTGHAEAVEVLFDPERVGYGELLRVFWAVHDPTQVNRQGPDVGPQYRSALFPLDEEQVRVAEASRAAEEASGRHAAPIATTIEPAGPFWPAEDYHQRYLERRGLGG
jgi:peptide-methionine (S)-S-oxide reductase